MINSIKRYSNIDKSDITIKRVASAIIRRVVGVRQSIYYKMPWGFAKKNRKRLAMFKNIHKGKRCFIIANGPSLKKIDFSLLEKEVTIGMNRIYLMKNVNGFMPTYLACIDKKTQIEQFYDELDALDIPCFFDFDMHNYFSKKNNQYFLKSKFSPKFSKDIAYDPCGNGKSVAYTCMQIAYYMGFSEVYMIGKDHNYNTNKKSGERVESDGKEGNHFIGNYYRLGQKWDAPDYKSEEYAYGLADKTFQDSDRSIMDATIGGKLSIFSKIDFNKLF